METKIIFGTYNAPSTSINLTASYTAPGILPKEMLEDAFFSEEDTKQSKDATFDEVLKGVLSVPKP